MLKDTFNKSNQFNVSISFIEKKTLVFELEGVLVNLLSQEEAESILQGAGGNNEL